MALLRRVGGVVLDTVGVEDLQQPIDHVKHDGS